MNRRIEQLVRKRMAETGPLPKLDRVLWQLEREPREVRKYKTSDNQRGGGFRRPVRDGKMQCLYCEEWISLTEFYIHTLKRNGAKHYDSRCNPCRRRYMTAKRLKVTEAEYESHVNRASGLCEICGAAFKRHSVDHCHKTGKLRGVLCQPCNSGLGGFKDSPALLRAAAAYLDRLLP